MLSTQKSHYKNLIEKMRFDAVYANKYVHDNCLILVFK